LTTRAQVNGYQFLLRRFEHALVRRDVRMLHDPMSSQRRSLIMGLVLGVIAVAGCVVLALIRPQGVIGEARIIVSKDSGALYVLMNKDSDASGPRQTLNPVLNLASARLIVGKPDSPTSVADGKLSAQSRGPLLGIPGAPSALPGSTANGASTWTLCDAPRSNGSPAATVLSTPPRLGGGIRLLGGGEALLGVNGGTTYLFYQGKHAAVDLGNGAVAEALSLPGLTPRPVSTNLLNATVAAPEITPPVIEGAGRPGISRYPALRVGSVIKVADANSTELYVIVSGGVQRISAFAADLIRDANSQGDNDISPVPPDALNGVAVVDTLPVDQFPAQRPAIVSGDSDPIACVAWSRGDEDSAAVLGFLAGVRLPLAEDAHPVPVASAGADRADAVYVPPGSGEYVQATGLDPDSARRDGLYYLSDNGVRYWIPDANTAAALGLGSMRVRLAPWQIVDQFIPGPDLTKSAALVAHDTLQ
jgi:type VII secretion protein EccB